MSEFGYLLGDVCGRSLCDGIIAEHPVENCSCHIFPPCDACTKPREYCGKCGWESADDTIINGYRMNIDPVNNIFQHFELRKLDETKIDFHIKTHTHFTQIAEGVYPEGTSSSDVEKLVKGTFGGRFSHFGNGRFKYIVYTD